jgi:hypothetical protein
MNDYEKRKRIFDLAFRDGEWVCYGTVNNTQLTLYGKDMWLAKKYGNSFFVEFYSMNPYFPNTSKAKINLSSYRNFVFECDSFFDPKDQPSFQKSFDSGKKLLKKALEENFPVSYAIYSGSKSIHMVLCLEESLSDEDTYKNTFFRLAKKLTMIAKDLVDSKEIPYCTTQFIKKIEYAEKKDNLICDPSMCDPSKHTRFPEVVRKLKDKNGNYTRIEINGKLGDPLQKVVYIGSRISNSYLADYLNNCPECKQKKVTYNPKNFSATTLTQVGNTFDKYDFMVVAPKFVFKYINDILKNASSVGMHHDLFKFYCLLAKTFEGITEQYIFDLCNELLYPTLFENGYPHYKLQYDYQYKHIKDAICYKTKENL